MYLINAIVFRLISICNILFNNYTEVIDKYKTLINFNLKHDKTKKLRGYTCALDLFYPFLFCF